MPKIERIKNQDVPYDLLFLADEDDDQISKYRDAAIFWGAKDGDKVIGMLGLVDRGGKQVEIVCIAVYEEHQNKKIGTELIESAIRYSKEKEYKEIIIKTGNCGLGQLYLYQRCGFRYDSINRDYFLENYKVPIYENNIRCTDQIVLKYRIYTEKEQKLIVEEYWNKFTGLNPEYKDSEYEVWMFCYGEYLPDKLIGLVKEGKKTGTSSTLELYEEGEEKLPEEGDISIITYGNGLPGCIIKTVEKRVKKFKEISEEEARLEGEGDLSLEYWRNAHEWFFKLEYEEMGKEFSEDIPVILERFEVIYNEDETGL